MKGNEDDDQDKLRNYSCFKRFDEREMDVIEMAVYGSVKRDGLQCRCWSVGEMVDGMMRELGRMDTQSAKDGRSRIAKFRLPNCT